MPTADYDRPGFIALRLSDWPFVQVTLLLLLFLVFVVIPGPGSSSGYRTVLLPATTRPVVYMPSDDAVRVAIQRDGMVFINHKWYPIPELPGGLKRALRNRLPSEVPMVIISADRSLPFASVRRLIRLLATAGVTRVNLETESTGPVAPFLGT